MRTYGWRELHFFHHAWSSTSRPARGYIRCAPLLLEPTTFWLLRGQEGSLSSFSGSLRLCRVLRSHIATGWLVGAESVAHLAQAERQIGAAGWQASGTESCKVR